MNFIYEPELQEYMKRKGRSTIIIELVSIDRSDIEISDLHVFLANKHQIRLFKEEKKYISVETPLGEILLPKYKFDMDENIVLGLKSFWIFNTLTCSGIRI